MSQHKIAVFLRVRPTKGKVCKYELLDENQGIVIDVPNENIRTEVVNNTKERHEFTFSHIFDQDTRQEDVFIKVAYPVIQSGLDGFNGTIFAYGQTGSGKTFTVTGGPEKYEDRGIIPRSLSALFSQFKKRTDYNYSVHVSYLEIYNDSGYDLLDPSLETHAKSLEDLPKVSLMEDEDGNIHLRNLSAHPAATEEDALNLLFLGDTNRTTSETPMNLASSRSHCIFTIFITAVQVGSDVTRKSKIHLVDLAGSERVYKTKAAGALLSESKYINLSLHYLERCIVALQERGKGKKETYIPYRNNMMTSVLRDSLGGNCKTSMIATVNPNTDHVDESMSTCRFAQRVACISNAVKVNEEVDPQMVIRRLKKEVQQLKEEVALLKGGDEEEPEMTEETLKHLRERVNEFLSDKSPEADLNVGPHMGKLRYCIGYLKTLVLEGGRGGGGGKGGGGGDPDAEDKIKKLQSQVKQRDNEIVILVNMINEAKKNGVVVSGPGITGAEGGGGPRSSSAGVHVERPGHKGGGGVDEAGSNLVDPEVLRDKAKAFEVFRSSYHKNDGIDSNKRLLKEKYDEAKSAGEAVNESRTQISQIKALIEQLRVERAMQGLSEGDDESSAEEEKQKLLIEKHKARYKDNFSKLREMKSEIENIQQHMEKQRKILQKDFEDWYNLMVRQHKMNRRGVGDAASESSDASKGGDRAPSAASSVSSSPAKKPAGDAGGGPAVPGQVFTGNKDADADIAAFYKAREELLRKSQQK